MAVKFSTGLRQLVAQGCSYKQALEGGVLKIFSGAAPADADAAESGTLLVSISLASGSRTNEVRSTGSVELTGGASGSVDSITVDGVELLQASVPYNASLNQTAADVADAINKNITTPNYEASASAAVITIKAMPNTGTGPNGNVVTSTTTTITKTDTNMASGVNSANGLKYGAASGGVITKDSSDVWSGTVVASGTAGYFRILGSESDGGGASTVLPRIQGTCGTSGADYNMSSTSLTLDATHTIDTASITIPVT